MNLYRFLIRPLIDVTFRLVAIASPKVARTLRLRRDWRHQLESNPSNTDRTDHADQGAKTVPRVHIHVASVGEFEQARPLIDILVANYEAQVSITFFSASGYDQKRNEPGLTSVTMLPRDTPSETGDMLDRLAPDLLLLVRYDLWPGLLCSAAERRIPVVLVCGVLHAGSLRMNRFVRPLFARLYGMLALILAVGTEDREAFTELVPNVTVDVAGDTRYDRVSQRVATSSHTPSAIERFAAGGWTLVVGSSWPAEEQLVAALDPQLDLRVILVPHEPTPVHIAALRQRLPQSVLLSEIDNTVAAAETWVPERVKVLVIDATGFLSGVYRLGACALVGGGFGAGVHSLLEPAAYALPVLSGPRIGHSRDATDLIKTGALTIVRDAKEFVREIGLLRRDDELRTARGAEASRKVSAGIGAAERILDALQQHGFLPIRQGDPQK